MTDRYMKATSARLRYLKMKLIDIERDRIMSVDETTSLIAAAVKDGFDRPTLNALEALSFNPKGFDTSEAVDYLDSRMWVEPEPEICLPGIEPTLPGIKLPGT